MLTTRIAATAMVGLTAVLVAGCDGSDPATSDDLGTTTTTLAPRSTPPASPTPTPSRTTPTPDISRLSAQRILTRTQVAAKAAASVRIKGAISDGADRFVVDLRLTRTAGQGSMTMNGVGFSVIVIGRTAYLKISDAFWRQQAPSKADANAMIALVDGRWIKTSLTSKDLGQLAAFASKPEFFDQMFKEAGLVRKTPVRTVDGIRAIGLRDGEGTVWVDTATARPIRLEVPGKRRTDVLTFTEYNRVTTPKAPPADDVIDGKDLGM